MSKKTEFVNYIENVFATLKTQGIQIAEMNEDAAAYWAGLSTGLDADGKPAFTDNGKLILQFLQNSSGTEPLTSKQIAEGIGVSSRSVSGSIRKLVNDNYVEKVGQEPCTYFITTKGKEVNVN